MTGRETRLLFSRQNTLLFFITPPFAVADVQSAADVVSGAML
jgi:hypothetical protein